MTTRTPQTNWKTYLNGIFGSGQTATHQQLPIDPAQVQNSAGGYVWAVDDWTRLDRFLILGTEGGTYYINQQALTVENAESVLNCVQEDGVRVVNRIVEISQSERAAKNDPALFVLAICAGLGDDQTRCAALDALPQVARIGTHLFHFMAYVEQFRGWGRGLRRAIGNWYTEMPVERLAYQAVKYRQRDGWSHRDALRLAHPKAPNERYDAIYHWIIKGWESVGDEPHPDAALRTIWAHERAQQVETERDVINLIRDHKLPWEAIPTQWIGSKKVWDALLPTLPMTALIRNLGRMTANGALKALGNNMHTVVNRLRDEDALRKARVHPIAVLVALNTYASGKGARGKLTWQPVQQIVDALDDAFYLSFGNVKPSGKRMVLALDVSGSMSWGTIAGVSGLTPRVASAAMALITAATEPDYTIVAFCDKMVPLKISPKQRLDNVLKMTDNLPFGSTDCALPMQWALKNRIAADAFTIYTDSETWFGQQHPAQALNEYRNRTGTPAKLVVVGMVANGFSIADPNDAGMLDVVGFDTATPQLISNFVGDSH